MGFYGAIGWHSGCSGGTSTPLITVYPLNISFPNTNINTSSASEIIYVVGNNLLNDITVNGNSIFEVSLDDITFSSSVVLTQVAGSVSTIIYVRFTPTSSIVYTNNIQFTSTNAVTKNTSVTGEGIAYIIATGGTITTDGDYKIHTFTGTGIFDVTQIASNPADNDLEYLVVAGGGGGGGGYYGGGGGAGGRKELSGIAATVGTHVVTVGGGGSGGASASIGSNGNDSSFLGNTSTGGGGGGGYNGVSGSGSGQNGGSGGGGTGLGWYNTGPGAGIAGQGNDGAAAGALDTYGAGGGGGGAGAAGNGNTALTSTCGKGGDGLASSITGVSVVRAGGGAGGRDLNRPSFIPQGGNGGGGNGADVTLAVQAANGLVNYGGGGGGACNNTTFGVGGNGGSGIVQIRYKFQ